MDLVTKNNVKISNELEIDREIVIFFIGIGQHSLKGSAVG